MAEGTDPKKVVEEEEEEVEGEESKVEKQDGEGQKNSAVTGVKFGKKVQYY